MRTALTAAAALLFATAAAQADPVGERAGVKAPVRGAVATDDRVPVALQREAFEAEQRPIADAPEAVESRRWTGNENEG